MSNISQPPSPRREAVLSLPRDRVWELIRPGGGLGDPDGVRRPNVPADSRLVAVHYVPEAGVVLFTLSHPSFDPVPDDGYLPFLPDDELRT